MGTDVDPHKVYLLEALVDSVELFFSAADLPMEPSQRVLEWPLRRFRRRRIGHLRAVSEQPGAKIFQLGV